MTDIEAIRLMVNLHCRVTVGLIDAADRTDTPTQRAKCLAMARDNVLEFKRDMTTYFLAKDQQVPGSTPRAL